MNEEAIKDAYTLFSQGGYNGDINQFKKLISSNGNALNDAYKMFSSGGYNGDLNSFKRLMGISKPAQQPVKKKDSTVLDSKSGTSTSVSSTRNLNQPVKTTPTAKKDDIPNVANVDFTNKSGKKPASNVYTGYPGKGGKRYKFENGAWFEELYTAPTTNKPNIKSIGGAIVNTPTQKQKSDITWKPITDVTRVSNLNKHFGKEGSTSPGEKIYFGYPGKEKNEYRIENGAWERRQPGATKWTTITDGVAIQALNKQFNKAVKPMSKQQQAEVVNRVKRDSELEGTLNQVVTGNLVSQDEMGLRFSGDSEVARRLKEAFPTYEFTAQGGMSDRLNVKAPNGATMELKLDNWTYDGDKDEAEKLKTFIRVTSNDKVTQASQKIDSIKSQRDKEIDVASNKLAAEGLMNRTQKFLENPLAPQEPMALVEQKAVGQQKQKELTQKYQAPLKEAEKNYVKAKSEQFRDVYEMTRINKDIDAEQAFASIRRDDRDIKIVGDFYNNVQKSASDLKVQQQQEQIRINQLAEKVKSGEMTMDEYNAIVEESNAKLAENAKKVSDDLKLVTASSRAIDKSIGMNYIIEESRGSFGGGLANKFVKGLTSIPRLLSFGDMSKEEQNALVEAITGGDTSTEYVESAKRGDLAKALFSTAESLGVMAASAPLGALGLAQVGSYAGFYGMSYYEMKDQLDEAQFYNKETKKVEKIPEMDKVLLSTGYGILSSVLENFGVDMALSKTAFGKNLANNIMKRAFLDLPQEATEAEIRAAINSSVTNVLNEIGVKASIGMTAEALTEASQSLAQVGIEEVYDTYNGKNFSKNKGLKDALTNAAYEGYLGAIGGGVMSIASSAPKALEIGVNAAYNKQELEALINATKIEGINSALVNSLKADLLTGKMTKEEAKSVIESFNNIQGKVRSMPDNLSPEAKSESLELMIERESLDRQIDGKDPSLVKPQKTRVTEINNRLEQIAEENAVQEQATSQVPLQPETGVSGEMAERTPETTTEQVTQEGSQEEIETRRSEEINQRRSEIESDISELEDKLSNTSRLNVADRLAIKSLIKDKRKEINLLESNPKKYFEEDLQSYDEQDQVEFAPAYNYAKKRAELFSQEAAAPQATTQEAAVVEEQAPDTQDTFAPTAIRSGRAEYNENSLPTELQGVEPVGRTQTGRGRNKKVTLQFSTEQMNEAGLGWVMQQDGRIDEAQILEEVVQPDVQEAPVVEEVQVEELAPEVQQELDEFETILADEGFAFEEEVAPEADLDVEEVVVPPPPSRKGKGVSSKTPTETTAEQPTQVEELASEDDLIEEENLIEEVKNSNDNIAEAKQRAKDAIAKVRASKWSETRKRTEIAKIREKEKEEVEDSRSWKKEFESKLKAVQKRIAKARAKAPAAQPTTKKKKPTAKEAKEAFIADVDAQIKRERDITGMKMADIENQRMRAYRNGNNELGRKLADEKEDLRLASRKRIAELEAKKANPSAFARFRKRTEEEEAPLKEKEVSAIEKKMNKMATEEQEFEEPTVSDEVEINPTEDSKQPESVISKVLKFLGLKSKDQLLRKIEDFDGIPMIMAMSDILSSGEIKDSMGNVMVVDGGLGFNTFGRNMELAWAGVTKDGAQKQYDEAVKVYEANKELFDRLWAEGKIPNGHIPMAVMRMGNTAVNSNEAVFRYVLPYIQSLPLENRKAALNSLLENLNKRAEGNSASIWYTELSEKLDNGELQSVEDVKEYLEKIAADENTKKLKKDAIDSFIKNKLLKNKEGRERNIDDIIEDVNKKIEGIVPFMLIKYVKENNIETLDGLFEAVIEESKKRAKGEMNMFSLPIRAFLYNSFFSKESTPEEIANRKKGEVKKNELKVIKALLKGVEGGRNELFTSDYLYQQIGDPSMMKTKMGDVVGVMGIDVLNGGVAKSTHNNYGYGPKGRLISFISNPKQGVDVFPEFRAKAARVFKKDKKGNYPNADAVAGQTGGAFFMDSAFRGAKPRFGAITDMDMLIGKLRFAFPEVSVSNTREEWLAFTNQEGIRTREKNGEIIYGVTKEGRIFLNPQFDSLRTPIHEFGHIWIDYLRSKESGSKGKMLLAKGLELVDGTKEYKKALKEYGDRDIALEEALVELLATKGDTIINAAQRSKFKSWMNAMFKYIKENLVRSKKIAKDKIKDLTLDEFINIGLADLFSGERVSSKFDARLAETAAKARKSKQTVVNNIVEIGRSKGISDTAIKEALKKRGYTNAQIEEALALEPDTTQAPVDSLNEFLDSINTVVKEYASAARKKVRTDMKAKRAVLAAKLKAMETKGSITAKQAQALLEKVNKLNLSNSVAVERFLQFAENVFKNAEYVDSLSTINKLLPAAKRNIKSKLGIANDLVPLLQTMLAVKPTFIPMSVFETYKSIIETIGQRQSELTLPEISELVNQVQEVNEAIDVESGLAVDLMERFESYPDKIEENGKVQYTETINKMLEDGVINEYEHGIMKKYRSMIAPTERKKKNEQELQDERNQMIDSLKNETVDASTLPSRDERNLANKLAGFIKTDALNYLTPQELRDLQKIVDNINNGFITNRAQMLVEKMDGIIKTKNLISPIQRVKVMLGERLKSGAKKALFRRKGNFYKYILEGNSSAFIDEVFGNFRERPFYDNIFKPLATALASFSAENRIVADRITKMEQRLAKAFKRNQNAITMSKFKMMTWLIQNEFESNPNSRQVNPAIEFLKKTIKETNADRTYYSQYDVKMFEEIISKYQDVMRDENGDKILDKDGNEVMGIDMDKLFDSFNATEKSILGEIRTINDMMSEKAEYTAAIIRGNRITPIANYISLGVINGDTRADQLDSINELRNVFGNSRTTSTRAKTLIERTGKVSAINFDPFSSVRRSASSVLMDYHLTPAVRQGRFTMRELENAVDNKDISQDKLPLVTALDAAFTQIVDTTVGNSFMSEGKLRGIVNEISRQGYRATLAGIPRMASEAISNMSYILAKGAKSWAIGASYGKLLMSPDAFNVLKNVGSIQTNRIYSSSTVSSQLAASEIFNQTAGIRGSQASNAVANAAQTVYNQTLKRVKNTTEATADLLMSTPDMVMIRPLWFGEFSRAFKKESGKDVDFEKIANNDEKYMAENKDAIDAAKNKADDVTVKAGSSDNIALGILRNTVKPDDTEATAWYKKFNSYMAKFLLFEYMTARSGINMLMKGNMIEKKEGIALIAAVTTRMMVYQLATRTLTNGFIEMVAGLLGYRDDEEEEEDDKTLMQRIGQAIVSTMTTLMFGRNLGNAARVPLNYGIERINEKYLEALRDGEYDMYEDALQYSLIPTEKPKGDTGKGVDLMDIYINTLGSATPAVKTLRFIGKKVTEDDKKREDAIERQKKERALRAPLEIAGSLGYIPLYKDIRKITMDYIYGDLDRAEKVSAENIGTLIDREGRRTDDEINELVKLKQEKVISDSQYKAEVKKVVDSYKKAIEELKVKLKNNERKK